MLKFFDARGKEIRLSEDEWSYYDKERNRLCIRIPLPESGAPDIAFIEISNEELFFKHAGADIELQIL